MNILIINQPLINRGDESAHRALIRQLIRNPQNSIKVLYIDCYSPVSMHEYDMNLSQVQYIDIRHKRGYRHVNENLLQKYPYLKFLWSFHPTTRDALKFYKWADVVLCAPGGINLGGFQDWRHLFFLELARYARKPLAYYGRSFGPFPTETNSQIRFRDYSYSILKYFSYLSIRDRETEKLAQQIGIPFVSTTDTTFLDDTVVPIPQEINSVLCKSKYMVFVPNELLWHYAYKGKISKDSIISFYCKVINEIWKYDETLKVVMLPQLFACNNNDVVFFREIAAVINDSRIIVIPDCYSSDIQQMLIRDAEFVVGARYHSIVFAINQNVPFIALSYEHKIAGLLETLGKIDCSIDISNAILTPQGRSECLAKIEELLPRVGKDDGACVKAKKMARDGFDGLVEFLNKLHG